MILYVLSPSAGVGRELRYHNSLDGFILSVFKPKSHYLVGDTAHDLSHVRVNEFGWHESGHSLMTLEKDLEQKLRSKVILEVRG